MSMVRQSEYQGRPRGPSVLRASSVRPSREGGVEDDDAGGSERDGDVIRRRVRSRETGEARGVDSDHPAEGADAPREQPRERAAMRRRELQRRADERSDPQRPDDDEHAGAWTRRD